MRTLIAGATGLIGKALLPQIDEPVVLTRNPESARAMFPHAAVYMWNPQRGILPQEAMEGVGVVLNLAGEGIAARWTRRHKERIEESRISATRTLVAAINGMKDRPKVLVNASAIGYYGSRGEEELTEHSARGTGFLSDLCANWEEEANRARELGVRVVPIRTGLVLAKRGGLIGQMLPSFKLGLGGRLADGMQWMSWVSVRDLADIYMFAANCDLLVGPINAVSDNPVRNRDFTKTLGKILGRPAFLSVPKFLLQLRFGEFAEVVLASQKVLPTALRQAGFTFKYPELAQALKAILT